LRSEVLRCLFDNPLTPDQTSKRIYLLATYFTRRTGRLDEHLKHSYFRRTTALSRVMDYGKGLPSVTKALPTVEIVEVIRRSEHGMTEPFICRGDDDNFYFVKGIGAGRDSQIKEWISGNPNLFWKPNSRELVVIDHNQAFDFDVTANDFFRDHIFHDVSAEIADDLVERQIYTDKMTYSLSHWDAIVAALPEEWFYIDSEMTIKVDLTTAELKLHLLRYLNDDFWNWK